MSYPFTLFIAEKSFNLTKFSSELKEGIIVLPKIIAPATGRIIAKYTYDYNGNRILKELFDVQGKSKSFYYPDENFVREVDEKTKAVNDVIYYYHDSDLIAKKENNKFSYYHSDYLGSISVVTDESGNVIEKTHYLPFGEILQGGNDRYLYTNQELDPESQLYYYGARYYSPYLAKFTQPDTVIQDVYNPQNLNRYSYALNNPYKYNDPSGNYFETIADIGFVLWDIVDIVKNPTNADNWVSLGLDLVSTATPVVAGLGRAYKIGKGLKAADKVIDAERVIDKGIDTVRASDKAKDVARGVDEAEKVVSDEKRLQHAYKHAGELELNHLTGKSWKSEKEAFKELNKEIISTPDITFTKTLRGKNDVIGYSKKISGKDIVVYVFRGGPNKGLISHTIKADNIEDILKYKARGVKR